MTNCDAFKPTMRELWEMWKAGLVWTIFCPIAAVAVTFICLVELVVGIFKPKRKAQ